MAMENFALPGYTTVVSPLTGSEVAKAFGNFNMHSGTPGTLDAHGMIEELKRGVILHANCEGICKTIIVELSTKIYCPDCDKVTKVGVLASLVRPQEGSDIIQDYKLLRIVKEPDQEVVPKAVFYKPAPRPATAKAIINHMAWLNTHLCMLGRFMEDAVKEVGAAPLAAEVQDYLFLMQEHSIAAVDELARAYEQLAYMVAGTEHFDEMLATMDSMLTETSDSNKELGERNRATFIKRHDEDLKRYSRE